MSQSLYVAHLVDSFEQVSLKAEMGLRSLESIVSVIKDRISLETSYAKGMERLSKRTLGFHETEAMNQAMKTILVDCANVSTQRDQLCRGLQDEVLLPVQEIKSLYMRLNNKFISQGRSALKQYSVARTRFAKLEARYREEEDTVKKVMQISETNHDTLAFPHVQSPSTARERASQAINKFSQLVSGNKSKLQPVGEEYAYAWEQLQEGRSMYRDVMFSVLEGMERNEDARIRCIQSAFRKLVIFETALNANRSYDTRDIALIMEAIDPRQVIKETVEMITGIALPSTPKATDLQQSSAAEPLVELIAQQGQVPQAREVWDLFWQPLHRILMDDESLTEPEKKDFIDKVQMSELPPEDRLKRLKEMVETIAHATEVSRTVELIEQNFKAIIAVISACINVFSTEQDLEMVWKVLRSSRHIALRSDDPKNAFDVLSESPDIQLHIQLVEQWTTSEPDDGQA